MSLEQHPHDQRIKNALTIDLEEWFHGLTRTNVRPDLWHTYSPRAENATIELLDILAENRVKATFFVLGALAERSPTVVRRIADAGHELASHGYSHKPVTILSPTEFQEELQRTKTLIQGCCGVQVCGFRAPYFSINRQNLWAYEVLAANGYTYDSSVFPLRTILYGYPGAKPHPHRPLENTGIVEYPVATVSLGKLIFPIGGGFYWRILPGFLIRAGIRRLNKQNLPAVLYLHPWELDVTQPRIPVSPRERLTHYTGRGRQAKNLRRICQEFKLVPLGEVHAAWSAAN